MPARNAQRRFAGILWDLDIPQPFELGRFLASLALQRQRQIFLHPFTSGPGVPCGVWLATARADHIFHEAGTTAWHATQIVLHEIAHMLLGHRGGAQPSHDLASVLAPDLNPALIQLILGRSVYATAEEQDAETLASLIVQRGTPAPASRPAAGCGAAAPGPVAALVRRYARRVPTGHANWGTWTAYWRLRPLWLVLSRAAPDVRLPRQPGTCFSARYRLHRRVIEIRDAELSLRSYPNGTAEGQAGQATRPAGLSKDRYEAAAESAAILAALDIWRRGTPTHLQGVPAGPARLLTGDDLAAEAAHLIQVSWAVQCRHRYTVAARGWQPLRVQVRRIAAWNLATRRRGRNCAGRDGPRPPPAASGDPARRRTYVFALEQAEQMFRAAITVGVATRPLQVFYGLNQAGRAIAAAAPALTGDAWELAGHGIRCDAATLRGPLPGIRLAAGKPGGRASFVRLSELLGSSSWDGADPVTLSDVWDCLPGNRLHPLCDCGESRTTPLYVDQRSLFDEAHPLINVPVAHFPAWVVNSPDGRKVLAAYLTRFPDVRPWHSFYSGEDAAPAFTVDADGWGELVMNWAHPDGRSGTPDEHLGYLQSMTRAYRGERWLFPRRGRHGQEHASADGLVGGTVHAVDAGSLSAG